MLQSQQPVTSSPPNPASPDDSMGEVTTKTSPGEPPHPQGGGLARSERFQVPCLSTREIDILTTQVQETDSSQEDPEDAEGHLPVKGAPSNVQIPKELQQLPTSHKAAKDVDNAEGQPSSGADATNNVDDSALEGNTASQGEPPRPEGGGLLRSVLFHEIQREDPEFDAALARLQDTCHACRPTDKGEDRRLPAQVFTGLSLKQSGKTDKKDTGIVLRLLNLLVRPMGRPDIPAQRITVLIDGGSNYTVMDEGTYRKFGLPITLDLTTMGTIQGRRTASSASIQLEISKTGEQWHPLEDGMTYKGMFFDGPTLYWDKFCKENEEFRDVEAETVSYRDIRLILGAEAERLFAVKEGGRRIDAKGVFAYETQLGWTIGGRVPGHLSKLTNVLMATPEAVPDEYIQLLQQLLEQYKRMNDLDAVPRCRTKHRELSRQEIKDQEDLDQTTAIVDGHVQVPMLWKKPRPPVPESYHMAKRRLKELEKRLQQLGPKIYDQYRGTIYDDVKKGYIRELKSEEIQQLMQEDHWFLPHFVVFHPDKPDRPRRVLDCAATVNGVSLNSLLRTGPNNLPGLVPNLHRFRGGEVGISADATEMFMQSWVDPKDEPMLCILWREKGDKEPRVFCYNRHVFGAKDSPAIAVHSLRFAVKQTRPDLLETVEKNVYMDDLLASCDTVEEAVALGLGVRDALAPYNFRMVKWASNSKKVLRHFNPEELAPPFKDVMEDKAILLPVAKALGMRWDTESDTFRFSYRPKDQPATTAAEVLSQLASVFDALQVVGPHIMAGKLFLQAIQLQKDFNWAKPLTDYQAEWWRRWYADLKVIAGLTIPRWYGFPRNTPTALHIFADASTAGYGAVMYLVSQEQPIVAFVQSKSRVANKRKVQTIPRLELQGLLIGVRMGDAYLEAVQGYSSVIRLCLWTDSSTAWHWVHNESRRYKEYIRNRLDEVKEMLEKYPDLQPEVRWVGTKENPADLISRGTDSGEHLQELWTFWTQGPMFLKQPVDTWPTSPHGGGTEDPSELARIYACATIGGRYPYDTVDEFMADLGYNTKQEAEDELAVQAQREQLTEGELQELRKLQRQGEEQDPPCYFTKQFRQGRLKGLACFMDEDGVVRVATRLQGAVFLSFDERNPILLPSKTAATDLMIKDYHRRLDHAGAKAVFAQMAKKFHVPMWYVKKVVRSCKLCRERNPLPVRIPMAPLDQGRVAWGHVFSQTGMDFFGPFQLAQGQKGYGLLFTCLTTRAVHLEATSKITVKEWALAVERFVARRGKPTQITCDRATTFLSGAKQIRKAMLKELTDQFGQELANQLSDKFDIQFRFIPAYTPHYNGATERLVRDIKGYLLKACFSVTRLSRSAFATFLVKAEGILNQRPLAIMDDGRVITPSSVLAPSTSSGFGFPMGSSLSRILGQQSQALDYFWRHWVDTYLKTLSLPVAVQSRGTTIQKGDKVLTHWEQPGNVFKGVSQLTTVEVVEAKTGPDGLPRRWTVKGPNGVQRDVAWNRLYLGEMEVLGRPTAHAQVRKESRSRDVDGSGSTPGHSRKLPPVDQDVPPSL